MHRGRKGYSTMNTLILINGLHIELDIVVGVTVLGMAALDTVVVVEEDCDAVCIKQEPRYPTLECITFS